MDFDAVLAQVHELLQRQGRVSYRAWRLLFQLDDETLAALKDQVPGMSHCGAPSNAGVADTGFDPLPALEKWVEEGVAPESIVMTKSTEDGKTEWTRPVCVYPNVATYKGSGDLKDAANWTCGGG